MLPSLLHKLLPVSSHSTQYSSNNISNISIIVDKSVDCQIPQDNVSVFSFSNRDNHNHSVQVSQKPSSLIFSVQFSVV